LELPEGRTENARAKLREASMEDSPFSGCQERSVLITPGAPLALGSRETSLFFSHT
jgi:hypothetical protein